MSDQAAELIEGVSWNERGLVPVVVQEEDGEVLTLAYMNDRALELSLTSGFAHYYSRSKGRIRRKGEVSGNVQRVKEVKIDCDQDALLVVVDQEGPACHTGERSCFYREIGEPRIDEGQIDYSLNFLKELEEVIGDREKNPKPESYTSGLFDAGRTEIERKVGEETLEVLLSSSRSNFIHEVADLIYHLLVLMRDEDVGLNEVVGELSRRHG